MNYSDQTGQSSLFDTRNLSQSNSRPLREQLRPTKREDIYGNATILDELTRTIQIPGRHILIHGPPGIGKTTTCKVMAKVNNRPMAQYQPSIETLVNLKQKVMELRSSQNPNFLFIDEIHRLDKKQQDFLLPHLEEGFFQLLGATTESPYTFLSPAILSRVNIFKFTPLTNQDLLKLISKAETFLKVSLSSKQRLTLIDFSNGDGRKAIQFIEKLYQVNKNIDQISLDEFKLILGHENSTIAYDKERHYNLLSALIKSMRDNQVDEALLWLSTMLKEGTSLDIICRRLIIFASEDIGNKAPYALVLSTSTHQAVKSIGLPEARIILAQTVTYLSKAPKSRASYLAINQAMEYVSDKNIQVPLHRRNIKNNDKGIKDKIECPNFYNES